MTDSTQPEPKPGPEANGPTGGDPHGGSTGASAPPTRTVGGRWWLIPVATFLVGLVLGGVISAALRPGDADPVAGSPPSTSTSSAPTASGAAQAATATVVVPAECLQVSQDSQALVELTKQAATAARELDAGRLSDVVRQLDQAQTTLRAHADACRAVDASLSSGTTPSATTSVPDTVPSPPASPASTTSGSSTASPTS